MCRRSELMYEKHLEKPPPPLSDNVRHSPVEVTGDGGPVTGTRTAGQKDRALFGWRLAIPSPWGGVTFCSANRIWKCISPHPANGLLSDLSIFANLRWAKNESWLYEKGWTRSRMFRYFCLLFCEFLLMLWAHSFRIFCFFICKTNTYYSIVWNYVFLTVFINFFGGLFVKLCRSFTVLCGQLYSL